MPSTEWNKVVPLLVARTKSRSIDWYEAADGRYAADLGDGSFHIYVDSGDDVILQLRTSGGATLEEIDQGTLTEPEQMSLKRELPTLFDAARRNALDVDQLWKSIFDEIED